MFRKITRVNKASNSSAKCLHCGLVNFADAQSCKRCQSDLSVRHNKQIRVSQRTGEGARRSPVALIMVAVIVVCSALAFSFLRQKPTNAEVVLSEPLLAEATGQETAPEMTLEQEAASRAAPHNVVAALRNFQDLAEGETSYEMYESRLNNLKAELNHELPSFVFHHASDETFRLEVAATVREYTAAANWWKTTIRNNSVLTEADRKERTQGNFDSARSHLANAVNSMAR